MGMSRRQFLQGGGLAAAGIALGGTPGEANADAPKTRIKGLKASTTICPFCAVGCGLLVHTKLWDIAAGLLIATEAGVILSGPHGAPAPELTLAAAPALWAEFSAMAEVAVPHPI